MIDRQPTETNISYINDHIDPIVYYEISDIETQYPPPSYNQVLLEKREKYKDFIPFIVRGVIAIVFIIVISIYYETRKIKNS
jgi:hypothetical protein